MKDDIHSTVGLMIDVHVQTLERLRRDIGRTQFETAIDLLAKARRVVVFGIGPSSAIAIYFAIQLSRFGLESDSLTQTGLLLADGLNVLKKGDLVVALAYSRVYQEIEVLLAQAHRLDVQVILLTDSLASALRSQVELVLPVARGNADWFSTHTATLGLIEVLLVGLAAKRPSETVASLKRLNELRSELAGEMMELPISNRVRSRTKRNRP